MNSWIYFSFAPYEVWMHGNFSVSLDKGAFKSLLFKITQDEKDDVLLTAIK
jgi:hypothetical protein